MDNTNITSSDLRGSFNYHCRRLGIRVHAWWTTLIARMHAHAEGIVIGKDLSCRGVPHFERCPHSSITIGWGCSIFSSFNSNSIGVLSRTRITTMSPDSVIQIGNHVGMTGAVITAHRSITIGDDSMIGANTLITDSDWHAIDPEHRHKDAGKTAPVNIGKNVLIGTRCIVLKGVTIGDNSVIGAGSVVTTDIPAGVIAAGNPCRVIKPITPTLPA